MIANIIDNVKSIFLFLESFFGENCFWFPSYFSGAESLSLGITGKTTPWITSICSPIWEKFDSTSSLITQCQNAYFFLMRYFLHMAYQSPLNTSSFLFLQVFFLINFITTQLQLLNFIITHQLHHHLSYLISLSFDSWIFWQLPFVSKFPYCKCWLPSIRLNSRFERHR